MNGIKILSVTRVVMHGTTTYNMQLFVSEDEINVMEISKEQYLFILFRYKNLLNRFETIKKKYGEITKTTF